MIKFFKNSWEKFCDYFYLNDNVERVLGVMWIGTAVVSVISIAIFIISQF